MSEYDVRVEKAKEMNVANIELLDAGVSAVNGVSVTVDSRPTSRGEATALDCSK